MKKAQGRTSRKPVSKRKPKGQEGPSGTRQRRRTKKNATAVESRPGSNTHERVTAATGCTYCEKPLAVNDKALFVEEEVGRVFCSEACIMGYFTPEIERLEQEYYQHLPAEDLNQSDRDKLMPLRNTTLSDPEEIWREKTVAGDYRYSLVSEFSYKKRPVWCVCVTLFLRGEPSFLYLSFVTRHPEFANRYRKGERVTRVRADNLTPEQLAKARTLSGSSPAASESPSEGSVLDKLTDKLADGWSDEDTLRAQALKNRRTDDIPAAEFDQFQECMDPTLQQPDEVWSRSSGKGAGERTVYSFIKSFETEKRPYWYVIVAKETDDREQLEILEAIPTRDLGLVQRFREGTQEIGDATSLDFAVKTASGSEGSGGSNRTLH